MTKIGAILSLLLIAFGAGGVRADDKPNELPAQVATHHSIAVRDHRPDYDAIAETLQRT